MNWWIRFAALVLGVVVFFVGGRESTLSKQKRAKEKQEADMKIASLNVKAASLDVDAENARKEIAIAQAQAAQANEKAEAERLERQKLEASMLPRTPVSTAETRQELSLFAGVNAVIEYEAANLEAKRFAQQLDFILGMSKWNVIRWPTESHLLPGVHIVIKQLSDTVLQQKSDDAATILSYQLIDDGIATKIETPGMPFLKPSLLDSTGNNVFIQIGEKPQPYLDAIKREEVYKRMDKATADAMRESEKRAAQTLMGINTLVAPYEKANRDRIIQKHTPKPSTELNQ